MCRAIHQNSGQGYFTIPKLISFIINIMGTFILPKIVGSLVLRLCPVPYAASALIYAHPIFSVACSYWGKSGDVSSCIFQEGRQILHLHISTAYALNHPKIQCQRKDRLAGQGRELCQNECVSSHKEKYSGDLGQIALSPLLYSLSCFWILLLNDVKHEIIPKIFFSNSAGNLPL